jgi:hypothetical protein
MASSTVPHSIIKAVQFVSHASPTLPLLPRFLPVVVQLNVVLVA